MCDRREGSSGGCEPQATDESTPNSTVLSPVALPPPPPDVKIEMIQPKVEMVMGEDPKLDECPIYNDVDSKTEFAFMVGPERPFCLGTGEIADDDLKYCGNPTNEMVKFKCFHCSLETKWKKNLRLHIETQHVVAEIERPLCTGCGKPYRNKECLRQHMRFCDKLNTEFEKHECPICFYETKRKKDLARHLKQVHAVGVASDRPSCTGCGKSFKNKDSLKQHRRFCEKSNSKVVKHKCTLCRFETKYKSALKVHQSNMHPVEKGHPTCTDCGKSYRNNRRKVHPIETTDCTYESSSQSIAPAALPPSPPIIKNEMVQPIDGYKVRVACPLSTRELTSDDVILENMVNDEVLRQERPICTDSHENEDPLNFHKYNFNPENSSRGKGKFKCFHCFHETKWKKNLRRHIATQHIFEETERPTCSACGKSAMNKNSLRSHLRHCEKWNEEVVKHECPICFYKTKWKKDFTRHLTQVHSVGETDRPSCTGCGKSFKNDGSLKQHLRFCEKTNRTIVKHKCKLCRFETKYMSALKVHLRKLHPVETIGRPICTDCGKSYSNSDCLKGHIRYCEKIQ